MTIRKVHQHGATGKWAYVEFAGNNPMGQVLGNKQFDTEAEAEEFSKGFASLWSYEWRDPKETRLENLKKEKDQITARLAEIEKELS